MLVMLLSEYLQHGDALRRSSLGSNCEGVSPEVSENIWAGCCFRQGLRILQPRSLGKIECYRRRSGSTERSSRRRERRQGRGVASCVNTRRGQTLIMVEGKP